MISKLLSLLGALLPAQAPSTAPASQPAPRLSARVVLELNPTPSNPRNSEGDFVTLRDGRILFVYTHFDGGAADGDAAHLVGRYSRDQGVTWDDRDIDIVTREPGMQNIMSVSLLRLRDGSIGLFYLVKRAKDDCRPYLRVSTDEAFSWSEPRAMIPDEVGGYHILNNDRVVLLASGRLVAPISLHQPKGGKRSDAGTISCLLSDDMGKTWRGSRGSFDKPGLLQEPGVVERRDGSLLMFCRTAQASQYLSESSDGGETWTSPRPSDIVSPQSPASIERIPTTGDLLLVWNRNREDGKPGMGRRTPLNTAISRDEGRTWGDVHVLEDNPHGWYCYTAIHFVSDHVLLAYCAGDRRKNNGLARTQLVRLPITALYARP